MSVKGQYICKCQRNQDIWDPGFSTNLIRWNLSFLLVFAHLCAHACMLLHPRAALSSSFSWNQMCVWNTFKHSIRSCANLQKRYSGNDKVNTLLCIVLIVAITAYGICRKPSFAVERENSALAWLKSFHWVYADCSPLTIICGLSHYGLISLWMNDSISPVCLWFYKRKLQVKARSLLTDTITVAMTECRILPHLSVYNPSCADLCLLVGSF